MDTRTVRLVANRIDDIDNVSLKQVETLSDGAAFDFRVYAPEGADVPPAERGGSMLRSVVIFDDTDRLSALTMRFPSLRLSDFPQPGEPERSFKQFINRANPPQPNDKQPEPIRTVDMAETTVPHFKIKRRDERGESVDRTLSVIEQLVQGFNREFY